MQAVFPNDFFSGEAAIFGGANAERRNPWGVMALTVLHRMLSFENTEESS
jgi:hypothetical protein